MEVIKAERPPFIRSIRFLISLIGFFGYVVLFSQRVNISVAIVCMVNKTAIARNALVIRHVNASLMSHENCLFKDNIPGKGKPSEDGPFEWDKKTQGFILSSYFYGTLLTQIAGGYFSVKFGAKIVLTITILISSILTVLNPLASNQSYLVLSVCRFLTGLCHGSFWPSMASLWAHWAPPDERSKLVGIASSGSMIGSFIVLSAGGFLCVEIGWTSIFYVFGGIGFVWLALWIVFVEKSPHHHRFISEKERHYIVNEAKETSSPHAHKSTPWLKIIKSKSFWGLLFPHVTSNFSIYLFLTHLPTYMNEILRFDLESNGILSSLPFLAFGFMIIVSSIISDKMIESKKFSKTTVRKIFNGLCLIIPMICIITLSYVTCATPYVAVVLLLISIASSGCGLGGGFIVNYNDVAGAYVGVTFGLVNTVAELTGILAPTLVGFLTPNGLPSEWKMVFFITAGILFVGTICSTVLCSAELEDWAKEKKSTANDEQVEAVELTKNIGN